MKRGALALLAMIAGCERAASTDVPQPSPPPAKAVEVAAGMPAFIDIYGQEHRPAEQAAKAIVLVFILTDCPIANSYMPELNRLHQSLSERGVWLGLIHADPSTTAGDARQHAGDYRLLAPVALDPRHQWVRRAAATKTPEAVVFSPSGDILYRGRIDDRYIGLGKRRPQPTTHDLRSAIDAVLAGQPVPEPQYEAVGCFIPEIPSGE